MLASHPDAGALASVLATLDATYRGETWHWHPEHVRGPLDVIVGAVLVQHTAWTNAERALEELRSAGAVDAARLAAMTDEELAPMLRVSGTPLVKTRRLRAVARTIVDAGGVAGLLALPRGQLRARLLATHGVGPETADAIALYAAGHRVFVVDAYTQRIFRRIGLGPGANGYDAWQRWFEERLDASTARDFQRHHAHIVMHGKALCRPRPRCGACPLQQCCDEGRGAMA